MNKATEDAIFKYIDRQIEEKINRINTAEVGTIESVSGNLVSVKITNTQETIVDIPFFTYQGGGSHLSMPIQPGDDCLVVFTKHNNDSWYEEEEYLPNPTFDISNGIALVGVNSSTEPIDAVSDPTLYLEKFSIHNEANDDLIAIISDLMELVGTVIEENGKLSKQVGSLTMQTQGTVESPNPAWLAGVLAFEPKYAAHKSSLDDIKSKYDKFKV